jgi:hypothetical protein
MSLSDYIPEKFIGLFNDPDFSKAMRGYNLYLIKEDQEYRAKVEEIVNEKLDNTFDDRMVSSGLKPLQRLMDIEDDLGIRGPEYRDEEQGPTIPEQITELKAKINYFESSRVIVAANTEPERNEDLLVQNTTLTQKANAIYEYLKEKVKPNWAGKTVIENEGIYSFFFEIIEEKLRWPEKLRGKRNAKKSIIERAVELHPDELELIKNKSGNKITGLALKMHSKRTDAYGC